MKNMYIVWTEKNKLGIPIIDEQHRGIISSINSLYYFTQEGHGEEIINPTMITLRQYVDVHFVTEESLLEETEYPHVERHKGLHKEFIVELGEIAKKLEVNKDSDMVLRFLKDWWLDHINVEDRKYASHVRKALGIDR